MAKDFTILRGDIISIKEGEPDPQSSDEGDRRRSKKRTKKRDRLEAEGPPRRVRKIVKRKNQNAPSEG